MWISKDNGPSSSASTSSDRLPTRPDAEHRLLRPRLHARTTGGRIYNTGINLANDALFSSGDGGLTWDQGTAICTAATARGWRRARRTRSSSVNVNVRQLSHQIFASTDGGNSCSARPASPLGTDGPATARSTTTACATCCRAGALGQDELGVRREARASPGVHVRKARRADLYAHWAAIVLDGAGGLPRLGRPTRARRARAAAATATPTPVAEPIMMAYTKDLGATWSRARHVARPAGARVLLAVDRRRRQGQAQRRLVRDGQARRPRLRERGHLDQDARPCSTPTTTPSARSRPPTRRPPDLRLNEHLPERHHLRRDRRGPPARRLLHERHRRARLRDDRHGRHETQGPGDAAASGRRRCRCSCARTPARG